MKKIILGIETSCDETSISLVADGKNILSNIVSSQVDFHKKYGGVVPEIASRKHVELLSPVYKEALETAGVKKNKISAVAITEGPGLIGALMVGMSAAKAIAMSLKKPLISVNHLEGHIYSVLLENNNLSLPFMCLIASGGHTSIVKINKLGDYNTIGSTLDDAAGEAYDKVAKVLGLSYPGGPEIEKVAKKGNRDIINFPRALRKKDNYDFSFSGLKTAIIYYLRDNKNSNIEDVAASFEEAVVDILSEKLINSALKNNIKKIAITGGVSANSYLRDKVAKRASEKNVEVFFPTINMATDNAAMIAGAAYYKLLSNKYANYKTSSKANYELS